MKEDLNRNSSRYFGRGRKQTLMLIYENCGESVQTFRDIKKIYNLKIIKGLCQKTLENAIFASYKYLQQFWLLAIGRALKYLRPYIKYD